MAKSLIKNHQLKSGGAGGGGVFQHAVSEFHPDDTSPTTNVTINGVLAAVSFSGAEDNIIWAHIPLIGVNTASDVTFDVLFSMSSAETSKKVSLNADVWVFDDGDAFDKAADVTGQEDELTVPNDGQVKKLSLTNIKIPNANIASDRSKAVLKLWRDVDGTTSNHSGAFQLIELWAYQT